MSRRWSDTLLNTGALRGFSSEAVFDPEELLLQQCDVLVRAALERVITSANAERINCRILAEAANGPTTPGADRILDQRREDIFVLPDILCNAGGVIVSYFEWVQGLQQFFWDEKEVVERLSRALERSYQQVLRRSKQDGISYRGAALAIGVETVRQAKQLRGLFP